MKKRKFSLLALALVLFASIGFIINSQSNADKVTSNDELAYYTFDHQTTAKCGADDGKSKEVKAKKTENKEKCGAGKCGDGKTTKENKKDAKVSKSKDDKSKCGDGKCGDGKTKEVKSQKTTKAKKEKCGSGKCGDGK